MNKSDAAFEYHRDKAIRALDQLRDLHHPEIRKMAVEDFQDALTGISKIVDMETPVWCKGEYEIKGVDMASTQDQMSPPEWMHGKNFSGKTIETLCLNIDKDTFTRLTERAMFTCLPQCNNEAYLVFGLCSEAGEVAGVEKKYVRGDMTQGEYLDRMQSELGDVMWYWLNLCRKLELRPEDVLHNLFDRLQKRKADGNIQGDGDVR